MSELSVPDVAGLTTAKAALAYAEAGWYVGPLRYRSKNPGSVLGKDWPTKTSRDPLVLRGWFPDDTDRGVFLHLGRSGALAFDVDTPDRLPALVADAARECAPPYQTTRPATPDRRHLLFAAPPGRSFGNTVPPELGGGWGEIRGRNGVIAVAPSEHEADDGEYRWGATGLVPVLPEPLAALLPDATASADAVPDAEVAAFIAENTVGDRADALAVHVAAFEAAVAAGESRHVAMTGHLAGALKEAAAACYPASDAVAALKGPFLDAVATDGHGQQGKARSGAEAASEWAGLLAWAVGQAQAADANETIARLAVQVPTASQEFTVQTGAVAGVPVVGAFVAPGLGLRTAALAKHIGREVTYAVDGRDPTRFLVYHAGVWRDGGNELLSKAAYLLLGNQYRRSHLTNVLDALRYEPGVPRIDREPTPGWVNVRNGLVDWRTGELHPHTPDVPSTVQLQASWVEDAECPAVEAFLAQVLPADCLTPRDGGPGFVWELLGYLLYSGNPLHVAVLLTGTGRNGKGTLLRLVERLVGAAHISAVTPTDLSDNRFATARLYGKTLNVVGDLDPAYVRNTAILKAVTGGDVVHGEHKYGQGFDFTPWAVPVFSANAFFGSADSSDAYGARWVVVDFPNSFLGREDRGLDARLQQPGELAGVLRRAVGALPALLARGHLPEPESVRAAKAEFVSSGDVVRAWLDGHCSLLDPAAWTPQAELWASFQCSEEGDGTPLSRTGFYQRLRSVGGVTPRKRRGVRGFQGVELASDADLL